MKVFATGLGAIFLTIVGSLFLIFAGLIYFVFTLWIVKIGAHLVGYDPGADFAVLSAALIAIGSMAVGTLRR